MMHVQLKKARFLCGFFETFGKICDVFYQMQPGLPSCTRTNICYALGKKYLAWLHKKEHNFDMEKEVKRVAIYARKSVKKSDTTVSIDKQYDDCIRLVSARFPEATITKYEDIGSGKNTKRDAFSDMMSRVDAGDFGAVVCWKLDRLSRSVVDLYATVDRLDKAGTFLLTATDGIDTSSTMSTILLSILAAIAQVERQNISDRVRGAVENITETDGRWILGHPPFGYKIGKKDKKPCLIAVPEEQEIVRKLYEKYASSTDVSLFSLTGFLKETYGITKSTSSIRRILNSEKYVIADDDLYKYFRGLGCTMVNDRKQWDGTRSCCAIGTRTHAIDGSDTKTEPSQWTVYLSNHEGFISSAEYILVQKRLKKNTSKRNVGVPAKHLWQEFSGDYVRCSKCGYHVRIVQRDGKEANISCSRKYVIKGGDCGQHYRLIKSATVRENAIEQIQHGIDILVNHTSRERFTKMDAGMSISLLEDQKKQLLKSLGYTSDEKTTQSILKEIEDIEKKIAKAEHDFAEKVVASPMIELVRRIYGLNIEEIKQKSVDEWLETLNYRNMTTEQRSVVVDILIDKIYLYKDGTVTVIFKNLPDFPAVFRSANSQKKTDIESQFVQ